MAFLLSAAVTSVQPAPGKISDFLSSHLSRRVASIWPRALAPIGADLSCTLRRVHNLSNKHADSARTAKARESKAMDSVYELTRSLRKH